MRRRLSLGADPAGSGETFGQAWAAWLAGKKRLRPSSRRRLEQIGAHWLLPGPRPTCRWSGSTPRTAPTVFDRIERSTPRSPRRRAEGRAPCCEGDVRTRPKQVGVATQHRVYAALREVLNHAWKQRHVIPFNPVYAVELEPEETPEAPAVERRAGRAGSWPSAPVTRCGLLFRLVVLRGLRRGEASASAGPAPTWTPDT